MVMEIRIGAVQGLGNSPLCSQHLCPRGGLPLVARPRVDHLPTLDEMDFQWVETSGMKGLDSQLRQFWCHNLDEQPFMSPKIAPTFDFYV